MKHKSNKTKMRKTKKRSRNHYDKTKKNTRNIKHKRVTKKRGLNKKGGFKNGYYICESEGCAFHPSLITGSYDGVTKLYHTEGMYNKEKESYDLFNLVDPEYKYHCKILTTNIITPDELKCKVKSDFRELNMNKSYYYIDMEYAGTPIGSISNEDDILKIQEAFIQFLINVLNLKTNDDKYIVHGDPHPGNICYKKDNNDNYIIKYIDLTNVEQVSPDTIIQSGSDIMRQISSLMGCLRIMFGFSNKIVDQLLPIVMVAQGRKYVDVLNEILYVLQNVNNSTDRSEAYAQGYSDEYSSPHISPRQSMDSDYEPSSPIAMEKLNLGKGVKRMKPLFGTPPRIERKNTKLKIDESVRTKKPKMNLFDDYPSPRRFNYDDTDEEDIK
jgi:hypothetical protein